MQIDVARTDARTVYQTLIEVVTPRPIAWVTTIDGEGRVNLAPFSFYNAIGGSPPLVIFAPNQKRDGSKKDTLRNIEATGEFVINGATADLANEINLSSAELPHGESEVALTDLTLMPSLRVKPPRLRESHLHLECVLRQVLVFGEGPTAANLVIGEVTFMHVADEVLGDDGRVDPRKLRSIGRLGADFYCHTTELFAMKRP
jgi:flavin reductase (DIM6/NTAB) family NADH-FMN oxidoreductase RutF